MTQTQTPWRVPVRAHEVAQGGARFKLQADAETRAAISGVGDFLEVPRLEADFEVTPSSEGGLHVTGLVTAVVRQSCVITLEPVTSEVSEPVDVVFAPEGEGRTEDPVEDLETDVDELTDGMLDLGGLAVEFLLLGVDPYPRKPDAVFEPPAAVAEDEHPFAALAALKPGSGKGS